ncbi:heme peroxidase family protein [Jatrophihabitans endophyticus]|uniref:heme peroxidase family protein n=1 Tax=Jatrophihabitans endophyticus TaxID=1206085 RepID=UPI0019F90B3F|nr:heme peroxidase [Jatrophihabitans endophyticus]
MHRHYREQYFVVGEGVLSRDVHGKAVTRHPSGTDEIRMFRFSRLGPKGSPITPALAQELAAAMTASTPADQPDSTGTSLPSGFTYLGQFVDHDLTKDVTAVALGTDVTVAQLVQGRSPALDLDSLYGRGPTQDAQLYADAEHLKTGTTAAVPIDAGTNVNLDGFDLPRVGTGATKADERAAQIPDGRNDENLAVAQTHLAFIRFHNKVVDKLVAAGTPSTVLFHRARAEVVRHYQWLLRTDLLPRLVDADIVDDVFVHGRKFFEIADSGTPDGAAGAGLRSDNDTATMPIEFSVAAYRLGHSMVRDAYEWNRVFSTGGTFPAATLFQLFTFTGTSGNLTPTPAGDDTELDDPNSGTFLRLPTNWIVDWRRLHDFQGDHPERPDLVSARLNVAKRIDTLLTNPLSVLPAGTFGGRAQDLAADDIQRNLAFRNLERANMVSLASGQQMAAQFGLKALDDDQIVTGSGGADLSGLTEAQRAELVAATPLWFYILREAELNGGKLTGVGGRIVVETFHRAMEVSRPSIVREPRWRPSLGPDANTFRMTDLLLFANDGDLTELNPLGDAQ